MALFKRSKQDQAVLPEIEKYYEAERRERAGLAWLLALVSVACIALVLIGLFLGGKWAYNRLTDDDEPVAVQTSNNSPEIQSDGTINDGGSEDEVPAPAPSSTPAPAPKPVTQNPAPAPAPKPAQVPSTSGLPSTGVGSLGIIFASSSLAALLGYQFILRRKLSS